MTETDEERIGKLNAVKLFDTRFLDDKPAGVFATLAAIHKFLFGGIYDFAGESAQKISRRATLDLPRRNI